jgi:acetolactate synthase-1/2/3 large subunit
MFAARYFKYKQPRSIITSGGLGTMGFGLPAAMGATMGAPHRTICLFAGDGGFQMNMQELGTIMEHKCPVKMVVLDNNYLGMVRQWQELFYENRLSWTPMCNPDFCKLVGAYGIPSRFVEKREDLDDAIKEMLSTPGPFLLNVAVRAEDNVFPMVPLGATVSDMIFE